MGQSLDIPRVIPEDWKRLDLIINKIRFKLGRNASPTFTGVTLSAGPLNLSGKLTAGSFASPIDVTTTRQYGFEIHYSGNDYDVTGIRSRAQLVTTDTTATACGGLFQAANNDGIDVGVLNGALIEAIGKSDANAATIAVMRGCLVNTEWGDYDTVTNLKTLHVRTHSRNAAGAGSFGTGYGIYIENEAVGGNGQAYDAGIYFKGTNLSAGNKAFTYGIDFTGGTFGTSDIKLSPSGNIDMNTGILGSSSGNLTIKPSSTYKVIIQSTTDSTTFFQVLDADGGTPIFNVDSTNERVGIRTNAPTTAFDSRGGAIFNQDGADVDFRIESDDDVNMFHLDAGNNAIGLRATPSFPTKWGARYPVLYIDSTNNQGYGLVLERKDTSSAGGVSVSMGGQRTGGAVVVVDDYLGSIIGWGWDGDEYNASAGIDIRVDGNVAEDSIPARVSFSTTALGETVRTERLIIKGNGKIGIGEIAPETLTEWTHIEPYLTLHNSTEEDSDGGRESRINFKGEQSGTEESTLARIEVGHDGEADDQKGYFDIFINDGNDGNTPSISYRFGSTGLTLTGNIIMPDDGTIGVTDGTPQILFDDTDGHLEVTATTLTVSGWIDVVGCAAIGANAVYTPNVTILASKNRNTIVGNLSVYAMKGRASVGKTEAAMTGHATGVKGDVFLDDTNTQNWSSAVGLRALEADTETDGSCTGIITGIAGLFIESNFQNSVTVTNYYGVKCTTPTVAGNKLINAYGLYVNDINTALTLNYAIYTNAGLVHFGGAVDVASSLTATSLSTAGIITGGLLNLTSGTPYIILKNSTDEYGEGGCETLIRFNDHAANSLAQIEGSHSGTADDAKGKMILATNTGAGLAIALTFDDSQNAIFTGAISSATLTITTGTYDDLDVSGVNAIFVDTSGGPVIIRGTVGGVNGQVLYIAVHDATDDTIIHHEAEELDGAEQEFLLHAGDDETLHDLYGGWIFINMNGTHWHDCSHAKHVP